MPDTRRVLAALLLVGSAPAMAAHAKAHAGGHLHATDAHQARQQLAHVQQQIADTRKTLRLTEAERADRLKALQDAEIRLGQLGRMVDQTSSDITQLEDNLQKLAADRARHEADRVAELKQLQADVELGYRRGRDDYFKLLLNQQNPAKVARLLKYYGIIQQARGDRIKALNETLAALTTLDAAQSQELTRLAQLKANLQAQQGNMAAAQHQRQQALAQLNAQIDSADQQLRQLQGDADALQKVIADLGKVSRPASVPPTDNSAAPPAATQPTTPPAPTAPPPRPRADTASAPGRCHLPVAGQVRPLFGSLRAGGLRWNGVLVGAPAGSAVHAIRAGEVVYADYLRGYGFLVIVDHGGGLMSLYGQNQRLLKAVGDKVGVNDTLALVGESGGNSSPALYFEVRQDGHPRDPRSWCH